MFNKEKGNAAKAGIGYTIGNMLIKGLSFLTLPIFTRLMSTAEYGLYSTYVSYESIISLIVGLGLHASLKAAKIEYKNYIDNYVSSIILLPVIFTALLLVILGPGYTLISNFIGFPVAIVVIMILHSVASSIINIYNNRISLDFSYKKYLIISFISSISNIIISLILMLSICRNNKFLGYTLGTFLPVFFIAMFLMLVFFVKAKPTFNKEYINFGLRYSLPLIPHGVSQVVLAQFGRIIIQRKIGSAAAGIYGFTYTIALIPQILVTSFDTAWGPWFFEKYNEHKNKEIHDYTKVYVAGFSTITVVLFAVSPEIIKIMAAMDYWDSIDIVSFAILGVFFAFLYGIPAQVEYFYKKTKFIALGTALAAIFNVVLCLLFVPRYGYKIAVYITVVTYVLYFIMHVIISDLITKNKLPFAKKTLFAYAFLVLASCIFNQILISFLFLRYIVCSVFVIIIYAFNKENIKTQINLMLRKNNENTI